MKSPFFLMFTIVVLLNINHAMLRGIRNTLAVVTSGGGAHSIPIFELCGALPGALLMTWGLTRLINRFPLEKVFALTLSVFLGFFSLFALVHPSNPLSAMGFYLMAEIWKPALVGILFWGLVNQQCPLNDAKRLYPPLMLGGSLGSILAGPLISLCTSQDWAHSFNLMILLIVLIGAVAGILYYTLGKKLTTPLHTLSLKTSIATCWQQPPLRCLSWLVIADYIAYSLSEVIFLHVLHIRFPAANDYCQYMGTLTSWQGILTLISSLSFTPWILKRYSWVVAALITPLSLLATGGLFFLSLSWTEAAVLLGSIQYCVCRAAKYTLFDASKELAFVSLPSPQRMQGKLVVDGLSARIGRGAASLLSIGLIQLSGGVMASSLITGVISMAMTLSWTHITWKLGGLLRRSELPKSSS